MQTDYTGDDVMFDDDIVFKKYKEKLKTMVSEKRFIHSVNVMDCAVKLAEKYGADVRKAAVAGLLHDCAKGIKGEEIFRMCEKFGIETDEITRLQPELLHGCIGAKLAERDFGVTDKSILNAIYYHTTGYDNMNLLDKIIFIADYIEPGRNFSNIENIRKTVYEDLDRAIIMALDNTLAYVTSKGALIHPLSVTARNSLIVARMLKNKGTDGKTEKSVSEFGGKMQEGGLA